MIAATRGRLLDQVMPRMIICVFAALITTAANSALAGPESNATNFEEITVTSQRRGQPTLSHAGNVAALAEATLSDVAHQHVHEIMTRVAGVWVSRGSGQEHLTAIRSPVLTGAGSCGSFLFLEDGIPIRPSGFCNVNQWFELLTEQARHIEVIRGPGNALYGSNALHGIVNVLMPAPNGTTATDISVQAGSNKFSRLRAQLLTDSTPFAGSLLYTNDGGFRDNSGYRQGKLYLRTLWEFGESTFTAGFSATSLRQNTAGFIVGPEAYKDPAINRSNPNPEAFRNADSHRLYGVWKKTIAGFGIDLRPYARRSNMQFLQHFLPGQPLEENGHISAGMLSSFTLERGKQTWIAGVDIEWSDIFLRQTQTGLTEGSDFLRETRPEGKHYDYEVLSHSFAPWLQADIKISGKLTLSAGIRLEYMRYDYSNNMLSGNTRDDGSNCELGGCLYSRPESRSDTFTNVAPKLAINYRLNSSTAIFASLSRGFRAPQATELYRLQSGQQVADLNSERLDSFEMGWRMIRERLRSEMSVYFMRKRGSVLRDSEGFSINRGRSTHEGIETSLDWQITDSLQLNIDASYARHQYDFNLVAARGEAFTSGNDIDTAPRWLASAELLLESGDDASIALQWTTIGRYFLDAENRFSYPGHDLVNLRARIELSAGFSVTARLNNAFNESIADRADYAFGNYRYIPGRGRELFVELRYSQ